MPNILFVIKLVSTDRPYAYSPTFESKQAAKEYRDDLNQEYGEFKFCVTRAGENLASPKPHSRTVSWRKKSRL